MKITCDNCSAKYSIADEKVKGKTFKIRCKKCGESIIVKGNKQPEAQEAAASPAAAAPQGDAETKVFDYAGYKSGDGDTPVWYVAVDGGEQQGPYSTNQMRGFLQEGNITAESFIWREGLDDWKAVSDVPEISGQATTAPAAAVAATAATAAVPAATDDGGDLFGSTPSDDAAGGGLFDSAPSDDAAGGGLFDSGPDAGADAGGDLFASAPAAEETPDTSAGGLFDANQDAQASSAETGGGLFDGPTDTGGGDLFDDANADGKDDGIFASTDTSGPAVDDAGGDSMTGQRNENSVLFSLSNLQDLASDEEAAPPAPGNNIAGPGMATNEASGLIDIRKMASSLAAEAEEADDVDDMLAMGGAGFSAGAGAPVLKAADTGGLSMGLKIGIAVGAVVLLAGVVVAIMLAMNSGDDADRQELELLKKKLAALENNTNISDEQKAEMRAQLEKEIVDKKEKVADAGDEKTPAAEETEDEEKTASRTSGKTSKKTSKSSGDSKASSKSSSKSVEPAPSTAAPAKKSTANAKLDALLGGKKKTAPKKKAAPSGGGDKLTRAQVMSGMKAVAPSVKRCGAGKTGKIKVRLKIDPTGRVVQASTVGEFAGSREGACAARAVRRAKFPRSASSLTVTFPFSL